jgi:hypothetical protein
MLKNKNKIAKLSVDIAVLAIIFTMLITNINIYAQHEHSKTTIQKNDNQTESIIRKGKIDLKKIDKNKDGKVFQCPMDWNVISDKSGTCPTCKMKLEEVTLPKAKDNLLKHGYKVK